MKTKTLWLGRSDDEDEGYILGRYKRYWNGTFFTDGSIINFCTHDFETRTGIELEFGELRKFVVSEWPGPEGQKSWQITIL